MEWTPWRRLTNDHRISDSAHRLWFWLYDCKDKYGEVTGDRAQAWYVKAKFGWKRDTVYKLTTVLRDCGYLVGRLVQGYQYVWKVCYGVTELPSAATQQDFPFLVPVTRCPPKGTPEASGCPLKGAPAAPLGDAGCPPKGTPYTNCLPLVKDIAEKDSPPLQKREGWKIWDQINQCRAEMGRMVKSSGFGHDLETEIAIRESLLWMVSNCHRELADLLSENKEVWKKRREEERQQRSGKIGSPIPVDPTPKERIEELIAELRRAVEEPDRSPAKRGPDRNAGTYNEGAGDLYANAVSRRKRV